MKGTELQPYAHRSLCCLWLCHNYGTSFLYSKTDNNNNNNNFRFILEAHYTVNRYMYSTSQIEYKHINVNRQIPIKIKIQLKNIFSYIKDPVRFSAYRVPFTGCFKRSREVIHLIQWGSTFLNWCWFVQKKNCKERSGQLSLEIFLLLVYTQYLLRWRLFKFRNMDNTIWYSNK